MYLCEGEVGVLAEKDLVVAGGIGMLSVLIKPLLQRSGPLRRELVARRVVGELCGVDTAGVGAVVNMSVYVSVNYFFHILCV